MITMLAQGLIQIPRARVFEGLLFAVIAWVLISVIHLVTPKPRPRIVAYWVIGIFVVLWMTGIVRITASGT